MIYLIIGWGHFFAIETQAGVYNVHSNDAVKWLKSFIKCTYIYNLDIKSYSHHKIATIFGAKKCVVCADVIDDINE